MFGITIDIIERENLKKYSQSKWDNVVLQKL